MTYTGWNGKVWTDQERLRRICWSRWIVVLGMICYPIPVILMSPFLIPWSDYLHWDYYLRILFIAGGPPLQDGDVGRLAAKWGYSVFFKDFLSFISFEIFNECNADLFFTRSPMDLWKHAYVKYFPQEVREHFILNIYLFIQICIQIRENQNFFQIFIAIWVEKVQILKCSLIDSLSN